MFSIPYSIADPNGLDLLVGYTEPRLLIEERYMSDEYESEVKKIMEHTGIKTVRIIPTLFGGQGYLGNGWSGSDDWEYMFDKNYSTPGRPDMPPMKPRSKKKAKRNN